MKRELLTRLSILTLILFGWQAHLFAQLTSSEAGYLNAVTDFGAVGDGTTVTTTALQNAIDAAIEQNKPLFLPAGTYLIDAGLNFDDGGAGFREKQMVFQGSSVDPNNRSIILLKEGTYTDPSIDGTVEDFEAVSGDLPAVNVDYTTALYYDAVRDLPVNALSYHTTVITGGVKWYNHYRHGDTWIPPTYSFINIENNTAPVNFYHFHAQHSQGC